MKDHLARWLGYQHEINELRGFAQRMSNARDYHHKRHTTLQSKHKKLAESHSRVCEERDQWIGCYSRLDAAAQEAAVLLVRARHTMNINPAGARSHLDQAVRILRGEA